MSKVATSYTMIQAILGARKFLRFDSVWTPVNPEQEAWLKNYYLRERETEVPFIQTKASNVHETLNSFLTAAGLDPMFDEPFPPDHFGVVSIMDLLVEWLDEAERTMIEHGGNLYPGIESAEDGAKFFNSTYHPEPVACLITKDPTLKVFVSKMPECDYQGFKLIEYAKNAFLASNLQRTHSFANVQMPMIDLNIKQQHDWLQEMWAQTPHGVARVKKAMQQTRLRLNQVGARVQDAAGVMVSLECAFVSNSLIIDQPFLISFTKDGIEDPLLTAWVTPEDWKEPANLD